MILLNVRAHLGCRRYSLLLRGQRSEGADSSNTRDLRRPGPTSSSEQRDRHRGIQGWTKQPHVHFEVCNCNFITSRSCKCWIYFVPCQRQKQRDKPDRPTLCNVTTLYTTRKFWWTKATIAIKLSQQIISVMISLALRRKTANDLKNTIRIHTVLNFKCLFTFCPT